MEKKTNAAGRTKEPRAELATISKAALARAHLLEDQRLPQTANTLRPTSFTFPARGQSKLAHRSVFPSKSCRFVGCGTELRRRISRSNGSFFALIREIRGRHHSAEISFSQSVSF